MLTKNENIKGMIDIKIMDRLLLMGTTRLPGFG
jgi:hypothetical protein